MGGTAGLMLGISLSTFVGLCDLIFQEKIFSQFLIKMDREGGRKVKKVRVSFSEAVNRQDQLAEIFIRKIKEKCRISIEKTK